jgi:hypothetical protein
MPTWADGELDSGFGTSGVVKIEFPNSSVGYLRDTAIVNDALEAAGFEYDSSTEPTGCAKPFPNLFVVRLSLAGIVIGFPSIYAQNAIQCPTSLVVEPATGDIYVIGAFFQPSGQTVAVARFSVAGTVIATYSAVGGNRPVPFCNAARVILDNQGRFVAGCGHRNPAFGVISNALLRLNGQSNQLTAGWLPDIPGAMGRIVIGQDASAGAYYVSGTACRSVVGCTSTSAINVVRVYADSGSADTSYGSGGVITALSADGEVNGITLDGSGKALIGGGSADMSAGFVARLDATGTPDVTFGSTGVVQIMGDAIVDLRTDHSDRVYALGAGSHLLRLNSNGTRDPSFASSSDVQTLNGPGSRWESMQFADSSRSSVYLVGGAVCSTGCDNAATTAVIAKVALTGRGSGSVTTTTVLDSSATTIHSGQSVTFTATITGTNPTGTVTFSDGSTPLATQNLSSARASYSTSELAVGSHGISAAYNGDALNAASTSSPLMETVNATTSPGTTGVGGGGSFALLDLCAILVLGLCRALRRLTVAECNAAV